MSAKAYFMMFVDMALLIFAVWGVIAFLQRKRVARELREAELDALLSDIAVKEEETRQRVGHDLYESPLTVDVVGFNRHAREMMIGTLANPTYVPFDKIIQVEVITGETSIIRADRAQASIWMGTDFGDMTVRSAVLADRISKDMISDLSIKITIDDWNDPVRMVCFLQDDDRGIDPRSEIGIRLIAMVDDICAKVRMIISESLVSAPGAAGDIRVAG